VFLDDDDRHAFLGFKAKRQGSVHLWPPGYLSSSSSVENWNWNPGWHSVQISFQVPQNASVGLNPRLLESTPTDTARGRHWAFSRLWPGIVKRTATAGNHGPLALGRLA
jgi:hypothetical protein